MRLSSRAYDLLQAFAEPGCPICRLTLDSVHQYLDSLIYEYANEPDTHSVIRAARGFCPSHAWHVLDHINTSAIGIAVLYEGLVRTLLRDMGEPTPSGGRKQAAQAANAFKSRAECPACTHQTTVEAHLLRNLLEHADQAEFVNAYGKSAGLCLPHLRQMLEQPEDANLKARLLAIQHTIWSALLADLTEFIRKHDYRFAEQEMGDEGSSPRRAIEQISGARGIR